eukprot:364232-Chlamydomonas_euryale.AAC.3
MRPGTSRQVAALNPLLSVRQIDRKGGHWPWSTCTLWRESMAGAAGMHVAAPGPIYVRETGRDRTWRGRRASRTTPHPKVFLHRGVGGNETLIGRHAGAWGSALRSCALTPRITRPSPPHRIPAHRAAPCPRCLGSSSERAGPNRSAAEATAARATG